METEAFLAHYRAIRRHLMDWQSAALATVPFSVIREHAKRINLTHDTVFIVENEPEMTLVYDLAVHTSREGRSRAIDRIAKLRAAQTEGLPGMVLAGLRAARFTAWQIDRPHETAGLWIEDLFFKTRLWLMDEGFSQTMPAGMVVASRLAPMGEYWVSCGAAVPIDKTVRDLVHSDAFAHRKNDPETLMGDRRFAEAFYRAGIESGVMGSFMYRTPGEDDPPG